MKTKDKLLSSPIQTTTIGGQDTEKLPETFPPIYSRFAFDVQKAHSTNCGRNVSKLVPFIFEARRNWKQRNKGAVEIRVSREDKKKFASSIPFLECRTYTKYTLPVFSAVQ